MGKFFNNGNNNGNNNFGNTSYNNNFNNGFNNPGYNNQNYRNMNYSNYNNYNNGYNYSNNINYQNNNNNQETNKFNWKIIVVILLLIGIGVGGFFVFKNLSSDKDNTDVKTDITSPGFSEVLLYSSNENDKKFAKIGDKVILQFKADELLKNNPIVEISGDRVDVTYRDGYYYAEYIVSKQYETNFLISFRIFEYEDMSGNKGPQIYKTTDNSSVHIVAADKVIQKVEVQSISFSQTKVFMNIGEKHTLDLIITPSNANYDEIIYKSSDLNVVEVVNGVLTAKGVGNAKVTAIVGKFKAEVEVSVIKESIEPTGISFKNCVDSLYVGETSKIIVSIKPADATNVKVTWSSSNSSVATVSDGLVVAKNPGKVTITASVGKYSTSKEIVIKEPKVEIQKVQLNSTEQTLYVGKSYRFIASVYPSGYSLDNMKWSSSNTDVARVDSTGYVTALSKGTATITFSLDGKTASAKVTVVDNKVSVTTLAISPSSLELMIGNSHTLKTTISPSNATIKDITWSSSNEAVASVHDGVVVAHKKGSATITGTVDGKSAKVNVVVIEAYVPVEGVSINTSSGQMSVGESLQLRATVYPTNASDQSVVWNSTNSGVVSVTQDGYIRALSPGTATITVTTNDGKYRAYITIEVVQLVERIVLNSYSGTYSLSGGIRAFTLHATVYPTDATNKTVYWGSSNPNVARVDNTGWVTLVGKGTARITAASPGGAKAVYTITIID